MTEPITRHEDARDGQALTTGDGQARGQLAPLLPAGEPVEQLLRKAQFFVPGVTPSAGLPRAAPAGRAGRRGVLPGAVAARQGGAFDARGELHRVVLVEGVRQGRDHHLGDPADRLPVDRARTRRSTSRAAARAARRSPGTPTRRRGCATPMCAGRCWRCGARRGTRLGDPVLAWAEITGDPERTARYKGARGKGGFVRAALGRGERADRRARTCTRSRTLRPGPGGGLLPDPGDVAWCPTRRAPGSCR